MKVTLSSSWVYKSSHPPLGIAYVAAVLRENDVPVDIIDLNAVGYPEKFEKELLRRKPDVFGVSAPSMTYHLTLDMIGRTKRLLPEIKVALGGPHPTLYPKEVMQDPNVDYVVAAEGEETMSDLVRALDGGKPIDSVQGIYYKTGTNGSTTVHATEPRPFIKDLDILPFPARDLLPMDWYLRNSPPFPLPSRETSLLTGRGCPFKCTYCQPTLKALEGLKERHRSPQCIIDEMEHLRKDFGVKYVWMENDTATVSRKWILQFCKEVYESGVDMPWCTATRVDMVDQEVLTAMHKAGCRYLGFGVESGSQRILDIMQKGTTVDEARNTIRICDQLGIMTFTNFMIGMPTETREDAEKTVKLLEELAPIHAAMYVTNPLPGTNLYNFAMQNGLMTTTDPSLIDRHALGTMKREMPDEEILAFLKQLNSMFRKQRLSLLNPFNTKIPAAKRLVFIEYLLRYHLDKLQYAPKQVIGGILSTFQSAVLYALLPKGHHIDPALDEAGGKEGNGSKSNSPKLDPYNTFLRSQKDSPISIRAPTSPSVPPPESLPVLPHSPGR